MKKSHVFLYALAAASAFNALDASGKPVNLYAVDSSDPDGPVQARIWASFMAHARPAALWYRQATQGMNIDTAGFTPFRNRLERATYVSFTYHFMRDGITHARVYHAMSGQSHFESELYAPRRGRTATIEASRRFSAFITDTPGEVVAWDEDPVPDSDIAHSDGHDGRHPDARRRDAELKISRKLETDIADGTVMPGGFLYGFSSQVPCASCSHVLEQLSHLHGIDVSVTYLEPGSTAYKRFKGLREQYVNGIHVALSGGQLNLLLRESTTEYPIVAPDCIGDDSPGAPGRP
ncbi:MAG: hypothetical protein WBW32_13885 [Luteibacter sp.]